MVPFRYHKLVVLVLAVIFAFPGFTACRKTNSQYLELAKPAEHTWLKGKRIFIDPGHGGKGADDPFRIGPNGVTEEETNLKVGLILEELLKKAGVSVKMSRRTDTDVPLDERARLAGEFDPELLVSIHHNGTIRKDDDVNYPSVLFWGSKEVNPASYGFAGVLLEEMERIMEKKGAVFSDFSIFNETGTRILRMTNSLCPAVIGEGGFFSNGKHALRLKDHHYLEDEALAYFNAISRYLQWGVPSAELVFSCPVKEDPERPHLIASRNPVMTLKFMSGNKNPGIDDSSLRVTLDGVPVRCRRLCDSLYSVDYGGEIFPGTHRLRIRVKNLRGQSSMVMSAVFCKGITSGDYARLVHGGKKLLTRKGSVREGLWMLLSALSMGPTDPGSDELLWHISSGFYRIGERAMAGYFRKRIAYFYPQSPFAAAIGGSIINENAYYFPAEFHGREIPVKGELDFCKYCGSLPVR